MSGDFFLLSLRFTVGQRITITLKCQRPSAYGCLFHLGAGALWAASHGANNRWAVQRLWKDSGWHCCGEVIFPPRPVSTAGTGGKSPVFLRADISLSDSSIFISLNQSRGRSSFLGVKAITPVLLTVLASPRGENPLIRWGGRKLEEVAAPLKWKNEFTQRTMFQGLSFILVLC